MTRRLRPVLAGTLVFCATALLAPGCSPPPTAPAPDTAASAQPAAATRQAAIAIPDQYGAQVAEEILSDGGNAVDAAVAVGFSMAVTFIDAGNIGGGGFMLIRAEDETAFLDYR